MLSYHAMGCEQAGQRLDPRTQSSPAGTRAMRTLVNEPTASPKAVAATTSIESRSISSRAC